MSGPQGYKKVFAGQPGELGEVLCVGMTDHGPVRLTCDRNMRAHRAAGLAFVTGDGTRVLDDQLILEMKYRIELPGMFKHLVERFALEPLKVSKYRLSLEALGRTGHGEKSRPLLSDQGDIVDA